MTRVKGIVLAAAIGVLNAGCAAYAMSPVSGVLHSDVRGPFATTTNSPGTKIGTAECTSLLGLVASGDCSIEAAMKDGGITHVAYIDYHTSSILGLVATFTLTVHGE
jgi:hypothetical protein